jgi:hypothetical protein
MISGLFIPDPDPDFYQSRIQGSKRHRIPDSGSLIRNTAKKKLGPETGSVYALNKKSRIYTRLQ